MEFGFFKGLPHTDSTEDFSKYRQYKNSIPKAAVIAHMNSLEAWLTSEPSYELFTKEQIQAGVMCSPMSSCTTTRTMTSAFHRTMRPT